VLTPSHLLRFLGFVHSAIIGMMLGKLPAKFLAVSFAAAGSVHASDFGTVGNITLPTARLMADGDLSATISTNQVAAIYNVSYQATPFLESTFRYTVFNPYGRDFFSRRGPRQKS